MNISCLLFDRMTTLDAIGPTTILARMPGAKVSFVGLNKGEIRSVQSELGMVADYDLADAPSSDIIIIPGGPGVRDLLGNQRVLNWLRSEYRSAKWIASVCTGSLLLGAAGLLQGRKATTHWTAVDELRSFGAKPVSERVIIDGRLAMGAGVSSGIDLALSLVSLLTDEETARAIQLKVEYDPQPPFSGGTPQKESAEIIDLVRTFKPAMAEAL